MEGPSHIVGETCRAVHTALFSLLPFSSGCLRTNLELVIDFSLGVINSAQVYHTILFLGSALARGHAESPTKERATFTWNNNTSSTFLAAVIKNRKPVSNTALAIAFPFLQHNTSQTAPNNIMQALDNSLHRPKSIRVVSRSPWGTHAPLVMATLRGMDTCADVRAVLQECISSKSNDYICDSAAQYFQMCVNHRGEEP